MTATTVLANEAVNLNMDLQARMAENNMTKEEVFASDLRFARKYFVVCSAFQELNAQN